jgi:hypothetical protein
MLLIIVLALIVNLALGSGDCNIGTLKMKTFDWYKVGISVLHTFYNKQPLKRLLGYIFHLWLPFTAYWSCDIPPV